MFAIKVVVLETPALTSPELLYPLCGQMENNGNSKRKHDTKAQNTRQTLLSLIILRAKTGASFKKTPKKCTIFV